MAKNSSMARVKPLILLALLVVLSLPAEAAFAKDSTNISPIIRKTMGQIKAKSLREGDFRAFPASIVSNTLVKVDKDGYIQVYLRVDAFGSRERAQLEAYGFRIEIVNEDYGIVQGWVPADMVPVVAGLDFVKLLTPPGYAVTRAGIVTTEGDGVLNANQLRAIGFDGSGVRVGVISDGVDSMATAQGTGDLPATVTIQTYAGSGDEGTAMLEIVHDLAPGAELGFCGPSTDLEMVQCINDLATTFSADIIVDDLGFFVQAFFEDDFIAQTAASVAAAGVFYTSSAGNSAETHYQGYYSDSGDGLGSHQISSGNNVFDIAPNGNVRVFLQWTNRFDGTASDDYDLCLQGEDQPTCATSNFTQDGAGGDDWPLEGRLLDCSGGCSVQVRLISGNPQTLELFVLDISALSDPADQVAADSIFGHPAMPGVLAAAAVDWSTPNTIESFSSRGPATIRFPAAETREKPDLSATDWVAVTGAGGFGACPPITPPCYFPGTSASAPHVAGVAALLMSAGATAGAARTSLIQTAVDLGSAGSDRTYGAGRIDALAAYGFIQGALQFSLEVDNNDSSDDDFCFISTAAYGSTKEFHLRALRESCNRFVSTDYIDELLVDF